MARRFAPAEVVGLSLVLLAASASVPRATVIAQRASRDARWACSTRRDTRRRRASCAVCGGDSSAVSRRTGGRGGRRPDETRVFYFGAVDGGVWKTTTGGVTWRNVTDGTSSISSVGAITVAPSDPNVIYVGGGEADLRED